MEERTGTSLTNVFINCPFTEDYGDLFDAMVFAVVACGFQPRSALESGDSGEVRMDKIARLIKASPLSIHDLSAVELDVANQLPRFNMPFELGLTLGIRAAGGSHSQHKVLILEREKYSYQKYLSDIAGQDLQAHGGDVERMILRVRNWLRTETGRDLPGPKLISADLQKFQAALPISCQRAGISPCDLPFPEFLAMQLQFVTSTTASHGA
jgi:hypothetical protein